MTDTEQQIFERQCKAYREKHGQATLMTYFGRGERWMCKWSDRNQVVLVKLGGGELILSPEDFKTQFATYFMDESMYYFGSDDAKNALTEELNQQLQAMLLCIEADESSVH